MLRILLKLSKLFFFLLFLNIVLVVISKHLILFLQDHLEKEVDILKKELKKYQKQATTAQKKSHETEKVSSQEKQTSKISRFVGKPKV